MSTSHYCNLRWFNERCCIYLSSRELSLIGLRHRIGWININALAWYFIEDRQLLRLIAHSCIVRMIEAHCDDFVVRGAFPGGHSGNTIGNIFHDVKLPGSFRRSIENVELLFLKTLRNKCLERHGDGYVVWSHLVVGCCSPVWSPHFVADIRAVGNVLTILHSQDVSQDCAGFYRPNHKIWTLVFCCNLRECRLLKPSCVLCLNIVKGLPNVSFNSVVEFTKARAVALPATIPLPWQTSFSIILRLERSVPK